MKLLLDEDLPHQFRHELPGHDCYTVAFMDWAGAENGDLLARAASAGFDALLTKTPSFPTSRTL
jgi:predicted nuclease of predicted toxin-antitoxin system